MEHIEQHRPSNNFSLVEHALGKAFIYEKLFKNVDNIDVAFFKKSHVENVLKYELQKNNVIKAAINIFATFVKYGLEGEEADRYSVTLHSKYYTLFRMQKLGNFVMQCKRDIQARLDDVMLRGSNWSLQGIHKMRISIGKV